MQEFTGSLANGHNYRVTPYVLEVSDANGQAVSTLDVNDIRKVERNGMSVKITPKRGAPTTLQAATLDDAGRLESTLRAGQHQESTPEKGGGFGKIMKWGCLGTIGLIVLIAVISALASGGDSDEEDLAQSTSTGGGDSVGNDDEDSHASLAAGSSGEVTAIEDRETRVVINEVMDPAESDNEFVKPAEGNRYYALDVTVEAIGSKAANGGSWKLRAADGFEYDRTFVSTIGTMLDIGEISPGGKRQGIVVFEIPEDAEVDWVRYDPNQFMDGDLFFDVE